MSDIVKFCTVNCILTSSFGLQHTDLSAQSLNYHYGQCS